MTDKEYRDFRRRISKLGKKWLLMLGFRHWDTQVETSRHPDPEVSDCVGKANTKWEYQKVTLTFYGPGLMKYTDKELEEVYVHECCHALVAETRQWGYESIPKDKAEEGMKHEERVVTQLTNAILWTYRDGVKAGIKEGRDAANCG